MGDDNSKWFQDFITYLKQRERMGVVDYVEFSNVDMVIEVVIEKISLKQEIFSDLENICPAHCILASNTSTIDLNLISEKTHVQDHIVRAHFFSPAHVLPLLEIVRTEKTSPHIIVDLINVGNNIKKSPIVVGNCTGFAVNQMFFPYTQSAHILAILGVDILNKVITSFGMLMGSFRLQGLGEVSIEVGQKFVIAFTPPHLFIFFFSTHTSTPFHSIFYTLFSLAAETSPFP